MLLHTHVHIRVCTPLIHTHTHGFESRLCYPGNMADRQTQWVLTYYMYHLLQSTANQNRKLIHCHCWDSNLWSSGCYHTALSTRPSPTSLTILSRYFFHDRQCKFLILFSLETVTRNGSFNTGLKSHNKHNLLPEKTGAQCWKVLLHRQVFQQLASSPRLDSSKTAIITSLGSYKVVLLDG
jgi:hypothetical protein